MKKCNKCKITQPLLNYYKGNDKDGYKRICKKCFQQEELDRKNKRNLLGLCHHCGQTNDRKNKTCCTQCTQNITIQKRREYHQKYHNDIIFTLKLTIRNRFRKAFRDSIKTGSAIKNLGCTIKHLKEHLETLFYSNMTWDNYGSVWHIDHIIPLSSFDLTKEEEVSKACHYTNLQPLLAIDNLKKSNKLNEVTSTSSKNDEILD